MYIEQIIIPYPTKEILKKITLLVESIDKSVENFHKINEKIEKIIFSLFDFSDEEMNYIKNEVKLWQI
jgi:restriction endonuclease S subunit